TTITTYGFLFSGTSNSVALPESTSLKRPAISSRRILLSSSVPKYLSLATRASILLITFKVVFTPTSLETSISSRLSKTSSSTLLFPATALLSLSKKEVFVFSSPLSSVSFFSLENIFLNRLILKIQGFKFPVSRFYLVVQLCQSLISNAPSPISGEGVFQNSLKGYFERRKGCKNTKSHLRKKVAFPEYFKLVIFCSTSRLPFLEP